MLSSDTWASSSCSGRRSTKTRPVRSPVTLTWPPRLSLQPSLECQGGLTTSSSLSCFVGFLEAHCPRPLSVTLTSPLSALLVLPRRLGVSEGPGEASGSSFSSICTPWAILFSIRLLNSLSLRSLLFIPDPRIPVASPPLRA